METGNLPLDIPSALMAMAGSASFHVLGQGQGQVYNQWLVHLRTNGGGQFNLPLICTTVTCTLFARVSENPRYKHNEHW